MGGGGGGGGGGTWARVIMLATHAIASLLIKGVPGAAVGLRVRAG